MEICTDAEKTVRERDAGDYEDRPVRDSVLNTRATRGALSANMSPRKADLRSATSGFECFERQLVFLRR